MTELAHTRKRPWHNILNNPVALKELRSRMRGRRAFLVLTLYLLAMSALIALVYLAFVADSSVPGSSAARSAGKAVFAAVVGVEVFMVVFVGPAFTAGAISGEKERQTYELLRTTLLSPSALVLGKLISSLSYVLLLVLASIPLQSLAFLLGGLSLSELVVSQLLIIVAALTFAMFGLFCSATLRTTLAASIATFAGASFVTFGLPVIGALVIIVLDPLLSGIGSLGWVAETLLQYLGLGLVATNLPATLILSELFLVEENALFFFQQTAGGRSVWLFSPWMLFIVLYALAALVLYWLTVRRVAAIPRR